MKTETKAILNKIVDIQIQALQELQKNPDSVDYLHFGLLGINDIEIDILKVIEERIRFWEKIKENPTLILTLDEYNLGICMHILYQMEDEWMAKGGTLEVVYGVNDVWNIFDSMYKRFHPEVINFLKF